MKAPKSKTRRVNRKAAYYDLEIRHSPVHGNGVFALEDIPRDRRVIEYTGKRLTYQQAFAMRPPKDIYLAGLNSWWCVDGRSGDGAQFMNHSCQPNLISQLIGHRLFFYSRRKIRAGEELTWRYRYPLKIRRVPCRCGARRCRGTLRVILS